MRAVASFALAVVVGAIGTIGALAISPPPAAQAIPAGEVIGRYVVKVRGEGFAARPVQKAQTGNVKFVSGRFSGNATILISARDASVNDGIVTVQVHLDAATRETLLGPATGADPAFEATAAITGDGIALIDAGQPNYVNALFLRFEKNGRKISGNWMAAFPAAGADLTDQKLATGVSAEIVGRRAPRTADHPALRGAEDHPAQTRTR